MSSLSLAPGATCVICEEQYGVNKDTGVPCSLPCGHVVCFGCVQSIQGEPPQCPYCRVAFSKSSAHRLRVVARPYPNGPGDIDKAQKFQDDISSIASKGIERGPLMKLISEIKAFLAGEPRGSHPELRLNCRMISYLGDLKTSNITQHGALKTVADELEALRHDKEKLDGEMSKLKKEMRELKQELEQKEITRRYEHETALAVEGSLREHIVKAREAYEKLIINYNQLLKDQEKPVQLTPIATSWEGVAVQDPDSSLISPHPLFLSPLPTTSLIRSLPDLAEDDEEEEGDSGPIEEEDDELDDDDEDSVTTPDDLISSHTLDVRDAVRDSSPHSHAKAALPPRPYEAPKSSLLSRTAPYHDQRRPRSSSSPTLPSNPSSRDRSPGPINGSPPQSSYSRSYQKEVKEKPSPSGDDLRFRLRNILTDKPVSPASLPNPSTSHFPASLTSRDRDAQVPRESHSSPPRRSRAPTSKPAPAAHSPPPPPPAPVTHSSSSPSSSTDPSYLLASHPQHPGPHGFISRPSSSASPNSLPRVHTSSASEQAKKLEEQRRKQKEERQAERARLAEAEAAAAEREREAQKNKLTPPSSVSASQAAAAINNPRDSTSTPTNKTPVPGMYAPPSAMSGSLAGNLQNPLNPHSSASRRPAIPPPLPTPPLPQASAHNGPYGRPAGPSPMHPSDLPSHQLQYQSWHPSAVPVPVPPQSGNGATRHGLYNSKGIYAS